MKKRLFQFAAILLLLIVGWNVWDAYFRSYGKDKLDPEFFQEFDPVHIVDNIDTLNETGLFEYVRSDTMERPERLVKWPIGSNLTDSPVCIFVEQNSEHYPNTKTGYGIHWETLASYAEFTEPSEELAEYKYLYTFYFAVPKGQIRYVQAGNSRKECMETVRENLLWLMSLT